MQSTTKSMLVIAAVSLAALVVAPAIYADDHEPSGSMMGAMMGRMGMMDHCGAMMRGDNTGRRPNDQWRTPR